MARMCYIADAVRFSATVQFHPDSLLPVSQYTVDTVLQGV